MRPTDECSKSMQHKQGVLKVFVKQTKTKRDDHLCHAWHEPVPHVAFACATRGTSSCGVWFCLCAPIRKYDECDSETYRTTLKKRRIRFVLCALFRKFAEH